MARDGKVEVRAPLLLSRRPACTSAHPNTFHPPLDDRAGTSTQQPGESGTDNFERALIWLRRGSLGGGTYRETYRGLHFLVPCARLSPD